MRHRIIGAKAQRGCMREVDWNGRIIHEYIGGMQHHDARKLANGNILLFANGLHRKSRVVSAERDTSFMIL